MNYHPWQVQDRFFHLETQWLTLMGEHLQPTEGNQLEYWRVEKADSIIIIPIQNQQLILPPAAYRPGVNQSTLDFPGGRWVQNKSLEQTAHSILQRELGISASNPLDLTPLNSEGWAINSSFSNQKLYGFVANLEADVVIPPDYIGATYPITPTGVQSLLNQLNCLQCRGVLLTWWMAQLLREP